MALKEEQIKELKSQLLSQIQNLPEDKKAQAQKQINEMSPEALETMLNQQKSQVQEQKIFRLIVEGKIPSKKIDENKDAIAVLDIKPISKGHSIIIPKIAVKHTKEIPSSAFTLAKNIAKRISQKLKSTDTLIQTESKFGEVIINIIPIYEADLTLDSPRTNPKDEEINEIFQKLVVIKKTRIPRIKLDKPSKTPQTHQILPRRIP